MIDKSHLKITKKLLNYCDMSKIVPEDNFSQTLLLIILGIIMFFIRTVPIHQAVFTDWPGDYGKFVNFAADDAVYHMRLVHNTIHHFPWRVFFDPFTHFPFGNQIHFGPLFSLIIATISLIVGLGHPTPELINTIGAYTPPIMGIICLIPVYFIARELCGKTAAIITTFILTFLPGEFLQRSTLGFTDHHVAEVLFSTLTCTFLICALNAAQKSRHLMLNYASLAGIAFGLFVLVWPAALMFGVIFLVFFITQLLIDHCNDNNTEYLLMLATIIYSIPTLMVLPYALMNPSLELTYYSLTQPLTLIGMAAIFAICYLIHLAFKHNRLTKDWYALGVLVLCTLTAFILYRYTPKLYTVMQDGCKLLFEPTPGMRTISEVRPSILSQDSNNFTIMIFWYSYYWAMPLALIGLSYLYYRTYKNAKPAEVLLLIWTLAMILAACAQCRFNYYLAINVAIVAGCYGFYPFIKLLNNLKIILYISFCLFAFLIVDPIFVLIISNKIASGTHISHEKYDSYMWLKNNTPDPQGKVIAKNLDYTNGYYPIPKNHSALYDYPKNAYGIMSWWDIGHQITYIAARIPNSNPFQLGVIESNKTTGAAPFFTSTDEKKAVENLDTVGSRYVLIEYNTAIDIDKIGIWCNDTKNWTTSIQKKIVLPNKTYTIEVPIDSKKLSQSMQYRLFYNDASELQHFRLIHESNGDYAMNLRRGLFKTKFHVDKTTLYFKNHDLANKEAAKINDHIVWTNDEKSIMTYSARPPVKQIKIFEKVKGATIKGKAPKNMPNNTKVDLTLKLKTKFDRIFIYQQTTKIHNGKYEFIVPYPTTSMRGDGYSYDIEPQGSYQIQIGSKKIAVAVSEDAVMIGKEITASL